MMKKSVVINDILFEGILTPAEPMIRYYPDGSGCPGAPAEFEIISIEGDVIDFINNILEPIIERKGETKIDIWEELSNLCMEKIGEEDE